MFTDLITVYVLCIFTVACLFSESKRLVEGREAFFVAATKAERIFAWIL